MTLKPLLPSSVLEGARHQAVRTLTLACGQAPRQRNCVLMPTASISLPTARGNHRTGEETLSPKPSLQML